MDLTCYPHIYLHGDKLKAKAMSHLALKQFDILSHAMSLSPKSIYSPNGLNQDVRRVYFNTGEVIECKKYFNQGQIHIYAPFDDLTKRILTDVFLHQEFVLTLSTYDRRPICLERSPSQANDDLDLLTYLAIYDSSVNRWSTSPTDPDDGLVYLYPSEDYANPIFELVTDTDGYEKGKFRIKKDWISKDSTSSSYYVVYAFSLSKALSDVEGGVTYVDGYDWIRTQFRQRYLDSYIEINALYSLLFLETYPNGEIFHAYDIYDYRDEEGNVLPTALDFRMYCFMMYHEPHNIDFTKYMETATELDTYYSQFLRWRSQELIGPGEYEDVLPGCFILVKMKDYCFFWDVLRNDYAIMKNDEGQTMGDGHITWEDGDKTLSKGIMPYTMDIEGWMTYYTEPYVDSEYVLWSPFGLYEYQMSASVPGRPSFPPGTLFYKDATYDTWFNNPTQEIDVNNSSVTEYPAYNAEAGGIYRRWFTIDPTALSSSENDGYGMGDPNYGGTWEEGWTWDPDWTDAGWKYSGYTGDYSGVSGPILCRDRYILPCNLITGAAQCRDEYVYYRQWLPYDELFYYPWFFSSRKAVVTNSTGSYTAYLPVVKSIHDSDEGTEIRNTRYVEQYIGGDIDGEIFVGPGYEHTMDKDFAVSNDKTIFNVETPLGTIEHITHNRETTLDQIQSIKSTPHVFYRLGGWAAWSRFPELDDYTIYERNLTTLQDAYMDTAAIYSRYFTSHIFITQLAVRYRTERLVGIEYVEVSDVYNRQINVRACCKLLDPSAEEMNPFDISESDRNSAFEGAITALIDRIYEEYPVDEDAINTWDNHMSCHIYMPDRNKTGIKSQGLWFDETGHPYVPKEDDNVIYIP
jgi:hypothetical protein